ncbi:alpha/beta hydrolase [Planomicrobium okeanokoites]|uniref:alpha/beta hydrolase n=1 Tax=Planomicrobium okeanokoites TaxID=244 RepID=UPI000A0702F8|nr:alpha/beta hydrolase [Planomicrobium okeanokoites]
MLIEKIQLWHDSDHAILHSYVTENSLEFQTDLLRPAIIICPGGGYIGTSDREAEPVALRFAALGFHAFVLRYTTYYSGLVLDPNNLPTPNMNSAYPQPLFDLAKAMLIIKENASKWLVDAEKIVTCGFSAGGHLAASLSVHWNSDLLKEKFNVNAEMFKPNSVILGYPVLDYQLMKEKVDLEGNADIKRLRKLSNKALFGISDPSPLQISELSPVNYISSETPPVFIWHTADDNVVYVENSLRFATELSRNNIPFELHVFQSGVHGLSLCDETTAGEPNHINAECGVWVDLANNWLKKQFAIDKGR